MALRTGLVRVVALSVALGGILVGCLGQSGGGSDSETHFACAATPDCLPHGDGLVCVHGWCERHQTTQAISEGDANASPSTDSGTDSPSEPPPVSSEAGTRYPITFSGPITATGNPVSSGELRVALVWYPGYFLNFLNQGVPYAGCPGSGHVPYGPVLQDTVATIAPPASAGAPARFELTVAGPPPAAAMMGSPFGGNFTTGQIIVYRDVDGNGRMDFRALGEEGGDEVLGASSTWVNALGPEYNSTSYKITYSDRENAQVGPALHLGYNLFRDRLDTHGGSDSIGVPCDSEIPIALRTRPSVQTLSCSEICAGSAAASFTCPDSITDLPTDGEGRCISATEQFWASYTWNRTTCSGCRCEGVECDYPLDPNAPPPSGWPCGP